MNEPIIHAIGTATPAHKISQQQHYSILEAANGLSREDKLILRKIYSRSGIEYRHSVLEEFSDADKEQNQIFHPSGKYSNAPVSKRMEIYEANAASLCADATENCLKQLPSLQKKRYYSFNCF